VTELADACRRLLADPPARSELAEAGLALIRERYTWERQVDVLLDLYGLQER